MIDLRLRDLSEKIYFHELEHRERINSRLQLPFAITLTLLGGYGYIVSQLTAPDLDFYVTWIFLFFALVSFVLFLLGVFRFKCAWIGHDYEVLPSASGLVEHKDKLVAHYRDAGFGRRYAERAFLRVETDYYAKCGSTNFDVNELRSLHLHKANKLLLAASTLLIVSVAFSSMSRLMLPSEPKAVRVELIGYVAPSIAEDVKSMTGKERVPPPPPPPPPPTRVIREGVNTPRPAPPSPAVPSRGTNQ